MQVVQEIFEFFAGALPRIFYLLLGVGLGQVPAGILFGLLGWAPPLVSDAPFLSTVLYLGMSVVPIALVLTLMSILNPRFVPGLGTRRPVAEPLHKWFWDLKD